MSGSDATRRNVAALFAYASDRAEVSEYHLEMAGLPVTLRFAGESMRTRIGDALSHLEVEGHSTPGLIIDIWDSRSTGAPSPPRLGTAIEGDGSGPVFFYEQDAIRALSRWGTLSVLDFDAAHAWFWTDDASGLLSWDWASPLRAILHWWLGRHGVMQVHGGAVGSPAGGVLIVGRGGSGKSTTTLSCLVAGLRYAGDDFVGLAAEPRPYVHSLYSSGKLESRQLERFPSLASAVVNPARRAEEKAVILAGEAAHDLPISGFPLLAVVVPRVVATVAESQVAPVSAAAALTALAPSTIFQLHPPQHDALARMAAILDRVPCLSLELGFAVDRIPEAISRVLAEAA